MQAIYTETKKEKINKQISLNICVGLSIKIPNKWNIMRQRRVFIYICKSIKYKNKKKNRIFMT